MFKKFKEFAFKGNVWDMAVGVIIGGAFSKIVTSLVNDMVMPLIGIIIGGIDLTEKTFNVMDASVKYGQFLQTLLDFFIISLSVFAAVSLIRKGEEKFANLKKDLGMESEEQAEEQPEKPTAEDLLSEIRDILKEKRDI